jgi:hypothetical protein
MSAWSFVRCFSQYVLVLPCGVEGAEGYTSISPGTVIDQGLTHERMRVKCSGLFPADACQCAALDSEHFVRSGDKSRASESCR